MDLKKNLLIMLGVFGVVLLFLSLFDTSFRQFFWTIVGISLIFCIYFLPAIIGNKKKNNTAIFVLNLFLGWTFIGWVIALVWATTKD